MSGGEQFLTGLGGAANQVLFGLPEFIARRIQGDQQVDQWIKDRQGAWDVGSTVGGVGSFFIPGGAIAKGLGAGAKAIGLGKVASGLDKASDIIKGTQAIGKSPITQKAIQGVAGALEQGIPRAAVQAASGDVGGAGEGLLLGTALGGGLGAGLGALGKAGKSFIGRQLGEVVEDAKGATAGTMGLNTRALRGGMQKSSFGGTRMDNRILSKTDEAIDDYIRIGKERGWLSKAGRDDDIEKFGKQIGQEYDTAINRALEIPETQANVLKGMNDAIDEAASVGLSSGKGADVFNDLKETIAGFSGSPQTLGNLRNKLSQEINKLNSRFPNISDADFDKLSALKYAKEAFEDAIESAPQSTLVAARPLKEIGKDYRVFKMAKDAALMEKMRGVSIPGGGSPTQAKIGIQNLLEGQGPLMALGGAVGASQGDFQNDPMGALAKIAAGSLGGAALTKAAPGLLARGKAAALPFLEKMAGKFDPRASDLIEKLPGTIPGQLGAGSASLTSLTPGEAQDAAPEMAQSEPDDILGVMLNRLQQKWSANNSAYGPADESNPYYTQWARSALDQAMPGGQIDPVIVGKILGQNKEQAGQIAQALQAKRAIEQNLPQAGEMGGGILGIGQSPTDQAQLARQLISGSLGDVASKAGVTQKQVDQAVQQIINGGGSTQEKIQKLMQLQSAYNPQAMAYLQQLGAV